MTCPALLDGGSLPQVWDVAGQAPASLSGKVHAILGSHAMRSVSSVQQALQNCHAALAPGGFLLLHELMGAISTCLWGLQAPLEMACERLKWQVEDWKEALSAAGFTEVATVRCVPLQEDDSIDDASSSNSNGSKIKLRSSKATGKLGGNAAFLFQLDVRYFLVCLSRKALRLCAGAVRGPVQCFCIARPLKFCLLSSL